MAPRSAAAKKFADLGCLSKETLEVLTSLGFSTATPVQEATIPLFCGHKDVAVDACTGSGKTLAFVLPVVERLRRLEEALKAHQVGAIIISPTRELAKQIFGVAEPFIASVPHLTSMLLVGGTDPAQDVAAFKARGAHVLVGTPGRIEDVLKRCSAVDLRRLEVLVLDEADRLLDMGFKAQLDAVMVRLPKQRRTGLFSATQTEAVQELARAGLRNPVRINVAVSAAAAAAAAGGGGGGGSQTQPRKQKEQKEERKKEEEEGEEDQGVEGLEQEGQEEQGAEAEGGALQKTPNSLSIQYVVVEADEKIPQLVRFLRLHGPARKVIVYCLTCAAVDHLALVLPRLAALRGVRLRALHGKMKQAARERELEAFRALPAGALLCTDLAARGLDIPDVHWIVQLDPPQDPAAFVHRVGRTARMGRTGDAVVYLQPHEGSYVEFLRLRKVPLTEGSQLPPTTVHLTGSHPHNHSASGRAATAAATAAATNGGDADDGDADDDGGPGPSGRPAAPGGEPVGAGEAAEAGGGGKKNKKKKKGGEAAAAADGAAVGGCPTSAAAAAPPPPSTVSTATEDVCAALRSAAERDREAMERATKAFVTYVRGYKEHHCKFIFRLQDLNVGRLATGLGLLRLPKMPDLKKPLGLEHFKPSPVDPATVPYKDKAREKQRLKALQQRQEAAGGKGGGGAVGSASGPKRQAPAAEPEARLPAAKRRQLQQIDEAANLNAEYSLLKKLKKGKISQHQYNVATGLSSDEEEDEGAGGGGGDARAGAAAGAGAVRAVGAGGSPAGSDDEGGGSDDDGEGDDGGEGDEGGGGGGGEGRGGGGAASGGSGRMGNGRGPGRRPGRQHGGGGGGGGLGVKQPRGALQTYIDKKTKKKKKKSRQQQQQQRTGL
ncbi:hypothetical protein PLESTF_001098500 [Pleodorina starrii]|nr:hypothetical protein PLESTF_001098500 [Pleodorina starrii]